MRNTKRTKNLSQLIKKATSFALSITFITTSQASVTTDYLAAKSELSQGADISAFASLKTNPLYPYLATEFYAKNLDRDAAISALLETDFSAPPVKSLAIKWWQEKYNLGQYQQVVDSYFAVDSDTLQFPYKILLWSLIKRLFKSK